jgi:hypothetical protein
LGFSAALGFSAGGGFSAALGFSAGGGFGAGSGGFSAGLGFSAGGGGGFSGSAGFGGFGFGFGGGGGGTISMLLMESPPLQRIFSLIFSGLQHTTLINTVFCFSSYTWSRISLVHKIQHHRETQSFSFSPCCFDQQPCQTTTKSTHTYTERLRERERERERETHEGIYIEFSSPSCSSDGTEDQPSAPLLLSPVKVWKPF